MSDLEVKTCSECMRLLPIKKFQGFKSKTGYKRSKKCRDCAAKRDVSEVKRAESEAFSLKIVVGRLSDRYSALDEELRQTKADFADFRREVNDAFTVLNEDLRKLERKA